MVQCTTKPYLDIFQANEIFFLNNNKNKNNPTVVTQGRLITLKGILPRSYTRKTSNNKKTNRNYY